MIQTPLTTRRLGSIFFATKELLKANTWRKGTAVRFPHDASVDSRRQYEIFHILYELGLVDVSSEKGCKGHANNVYRATGTFDLTYREKTREKPGSRRKDPVLSTATRHFINLLTRHGQVVRESFQEMLCLDLKKHTRLLSDIVNVFRALNVIHCFSKDEKNSIVMYKLSSEDIRNRQVPFEEIVVASPSLK